jgi:hypothetical protein
MFIGHFALGYAAKRLAPRLSLAVLFAAAIFADLLWPLLVAARIEQVRIVPGITAFTPLEFLSYPYSHSLVTLILWGALFGWATTLLQAQSSSGVSRGMRGSARSFVVVLALVVSHWVLDFVTHIPDLPLYPGSAKFGLGLWNAPAVTIVIEAAMFGAGVLIYSRVTRSRDRIGRWAFVGITAFLAVVFVVNAASPPPPSVRMIWIGALALGGLTVALAYWADAHRFASRQSQS